MKGRLRDRLLRRVTRNAKPVHTCEICGREGVTRSGRWDRCPGGHVYIGKRATS